MLSNGKLKFEGTKLQMINLLASLKVVESENQQLQLLARDKIHKCIHVKFHAFLIQTFIATNLPSKSNSAIYPISN